MGVANITQMVEDIGCCLFCLFYLIGEDDFSDRLYTSMSVFQRKEQASTFDLFRPQCRSPEILRDSLG